MKTKIKNQHSEEFYRTKYNEYKEWCRDKGLTNPFTSQNGFESAWDTYREEGSKNPLRQMKYDTQYETQIDTARAELEFLKASNLGENVKLKDLKLMSTQEFYNLYKDEIEAYRADIKSAGYNSYNANKLIAIHFYGSK